MNNNDSCRCGREEERTQLDFKVSDLLLLLSVPFHLVHQVLNMIMNIFPIYMPINLLQYYRNSKINLNNEPYTQISTFSLDKKLQILITEISLAEISSLIQRFYRPILDDCLALPITPPPLNNKLLIALPLPCIFTVIRSNHKINMCMHFQIDPAYLIYMTIDQAE